MGKSVREIVVSELLESMKDGVVPWHKPWFHLTKLNVRGTCYRGVNRMLLSRYDDVLYMTFKQCGELGGKVKKDEKGKMVVFWKINKIETRNEKGETEIKTVPILRYYKVWGLSQVELPEKVTDKLKAKYETERKKAETLPDSTIEEFLKMTGVKVNRIESDSAHYTPSSDSITMPLITQFKTPDAYYKTHFHELTHWTGHESRCNRDLSGRFGSEKYAKEELTAEIASSMLCYHFNLDTQIEMTASYCDDWMQAIRDHNNIIFSASRQSEEAIKWLSEKVLTDEQTEKKAS